MRCCVRRWIQRAVYVWRRGVAGGHESVRGKERTREAQCTRRKSSRANSVGRGGDTEQTRDASDERTTVGGHSQSRTLPPLFHECERSGVFDGIAADGERSVIAAIFAFGADAFVQPPDGRMIEEQRLGGDLKKINEAIEAANVGELVGNDSGELIFGKAAERGYRQENDGTEPVDDSRRFEREAFAITNRAFDMHAALKRVTLLQKRGSNGTGAVATHTLDDHEASGCAQAEKDDAGKPGFDKPQKHDRTERHGRRNIRGSGRETWRHRRCECGARFARSEVLGEIRGGGMLQYKECNDGRDEHQRECGKSDDVARGRSATGGHYCGADAGESEPLLEKMQERPAESVREQG